MNPEQEVVKSTLKNQQIRAKIPVKTEAKKQHK